MLRPKKTDYWRGVGLIFFFAYMTAVLAWAGLGSYLLIKDIYSSPGFPVAIRIMLPLLGLIALGALVVGAYRYYLQLKSVLVKERQIAPRHPRFMSLRVVLAAFWLQK